LLGISVAQVQSDRITIASDFAMKHKVVLVLKGAGTVVALPDGNVFVNSTGNAGMATGGSGDVLAGIIAGMLAQGFAPATAACLGVYIHGAAGDRAAGQKGEISMLAGDLIEMLPSALQEFMSGPDDDHDQC